TREVGTDDALHRGYLLSAVEAVVDACDVRGLFVVLQGAINLAAGLQQVTQRQQLLWQCGREGAFRDLQFGNGAFVGGNVAVRARLEVPAVGHQPVPECDLVPGWQRPGFPPQGFRACLGSRHELQHHWLEKQVLELAFTLRRSEWGCCKQYET